MKEYQLVESRLDSSHCFQGDFYCVVCSKPRCLHALTDFTASTIPSALPTDPKASYRGHIYWARPGGMSQQEKEELYAQQRQERKVIEAAIERDKEAFRLRQAKP